MARLSKNSSNSSKPPSSDIVKPPKLPPPAGGDGGKICGQPGYVRHVRPLLPPEQIDAVREYRLAQCPDCGGRVQACPPARRQVRVLQQIELVERPVIVTEHRGEAVWCPHCRKVQATPLPAALTQAGLLGPRLTALAGWFKSRGHDSYAILAEFLQDVGGVRVSRGQLAKAIGKVSATLAVPYATLCQALPRQALLNDRYPVQAMTQDIFGLLFADRGYVSQGLFEKLYRRAIKDASIRRLCRGAHAASGTQSISACWTRWR